MNSRTSILILCFGLLFGLGCKTQDKGAGTGANRLLGEWKLVYQEVGGKGVPDKAASKYIDGKMIFSGNTIHYTAELQGFDFVFTYKTDENQKPKQIDLELIKTVDEQGEGTRFLGIYKLTGNELTICYSHVVRPVDFQTKPGSRQTLIVLSRKR